MNIQTAYGKYPAIFLNFLWIPIYILDTAHKYLGAKTFLNNFVYLNFTMFFYGYMHDILFMYVFQSQSLKSIKDSETRLKDFKLYIWVKGDYNIINCDLNIMNQYFKF